MLSGRQIEQLQEALLDAFPSRDALRMLARIELEQNLDAIAGGENLRVLVFNLIWWAEQTGAVARLIDGACRQNAGNAKLRDVQRHFGRVVAKPPITFDWVEIPAGPFLMGSDKQKDRHAREAEMPQHTVTLPAYRITRTPVTVAQFAVFVQSTGYQTDAERQGCTYHESGPGNTFVEGANWLYPYGLDRDIDEMQNRPVTCVTWKDAITFCKWASEATGETLRLPTEAEWEKAARGTDGRIFPWGNEEPSEQKSEERCWFGAYVPRAMPVGRYPKGASPYGVLDMVCNVHEWTTTKWVSSYQNYGSDNSPEDHASYTLRGAPSSDWAGYIRCAFRTDSNGSWLYMPYLVGFRVMALGL